MVFAVNQVGIYTFSSALITFCALILSSHLTVLIYMANAKENDHGIKIVLSNYGVTIKKFFVCSLILSIILSLLAFISFFINNETILPIFSFIILVFAILEIIVLFLTIKSVIEIVFNKDKYKTEELGIEK